MRLTDDLAGVNASGDYADPILATQFWLEPLIGTQRAYGMPERVSGTGLDGVYEALVTLPKSSKEGVWRVGRLALVDKVGNMTIWSPDDAAAPLAGLDGLVLVNTATARQVTIERDWTIATAHTSATFSAGTVVSRADDGRFAFSEMTAQEFALDEEVPQEGLDGVPVVTLRLGIPGLGLSFSKPVAVSMAVGAKYDGYRLAIQSLTEGAAVWADEQAADVVDGRCRFTVTHATRLRRQSRPAEPEAPHARGGPARRDAHHRRQGLRRAAWREPRAGRLQAVRQVPLVEPHPHHLQGAGEDEAGQAQGEAGDARRDGPGRDGHRQEIARFHYVPRFFVPSPWGSD